jgi:nitrate/nitrite transport system ATP-binding protein
VNHDPQYRQLRAAITQYLMDVEGREAHRREPEGAVKLPDVVPISAADFLPKAVRAVTKPRPLANPDKYVEFYNVHKVYPTPKGPLTVVEGFQLDIKRGECVSLIGHSGCGKSTALSMCAGLTDVTDGSIMLDDREVTSAGPDRGVVFQAPNLLSWLTARQNVALGVDRVYPHATRAERATSSTTT